MSEVASERLNYLSKKSRAVSSRSSRQIIPCSNGVTFQAGQTARIDISGNQMATYMDWQDSYLKFTVKNSNAATISLENCYALIEKLEILADGATISSISNYGAAMASYLDSEVGIDWKDGFGRALVGTNYNADYLEQIGNGKERTFCAPLPLCPLWCDKYIPLMGRSTISVRITWASAAKGTIGAAVDSDIVINPVELVTSMVRLSAEANAMVLANTGGRIEIVTSDIRTAEGNVTAGENVLNLNCGFSFSSLDRVSFGFYGTLNTALATSVGNRGCGNLTEYSLSINGEQHPRRPIQVSATNVAEAYAELAIGHRSLADFNHQSSMAPEQLLTDATNAALPTYGARYYSGSPTGLTGDKKGTHEATTGRFLAMIDTESMKPHDSGNTLYSGLSTLGSVVQLTGTLATAPQNATVLCFAQYTMAMTLDLNGSQTWVVSI